MPFAFAPISSSDESSQQSHSTTSTASILRPARQQSEAVRRALAYMEDVKESQKREKLATAVAASGK